MSAIKLYELTESYSVLLQMVEDMNDQDLEMALTQIKGEITEKAISIGKMVRAIDYDIDTLKAEEKRLADRRRALENKRDNIKRYIQTQMEKVGLDKIKSPLLTVSIQNNPPAVQIADEKLIPARFLTIIPEQKVPDKKAIAEVLKSGEEVPGASLTQGKSLRIR
jgi:hypothetical protein